MSLDRRAFLGTTLASAAFLAVRPLLAASFELEEVTFAALAAGMRDGKFTSRRLTELYLARIASLDKPVASVLYTNPDAIRDADALDAERKAGKVRGPLHGIPILIKGNIDTADKMATTAGSLALAGRIAKKDAFVVARLRAAGCVLLGKTNLSEWANIRSTHSSSGWSGEGGQCRNPYALDRSPSGSSSGSGVAASANFCAAAVGTETDGSILSPSSCQGLVGIKPTVGLVSRNGIIPIAHTQDTAGPMARCVADAAALLSGMTGTDPADAATAASKPAPDYTTFLTADGLKGARIGVARKRYFGGHPAADRVGETAIKVLRDAGAIIVDPANVAADGVDDAELDVLLYELKADLDTYLAAAAAPVKSLAELIAWNDAHAKEEMSVFGQELFLQAVKKNPLTDAAYKKALAKCKKQSQAIDRTMAKHKLDAVLAPTGGPAWLIDWVNGDSGSGTSSTSPTAVAGYPAITVPGGDAHGLPIGVSFMGRPWTEGTLIRIAYGFEQATKVRKLPDFRPSVKLG
jgi:amidase